MSVNISQYPTDWSEALSRPCKKHAPNDKLFVLGIGFDAFARVRAQKGPSVDVAQAWRWLRAIATVAAVGAASADARKVLRAAGALAFHAASHAVQVCWENGQTGQCSFRFYI